MITHTTGTRSGSGSYNRPDDVSPGWHLKMILALIHAASSEAGGATPDEKVEAALVATVLGAVGRPG